MDSQTILMIAEGIRDSLYMTIVSTLVGYLIGLPWGIVLAVCAREGIKPNAAVYRPGGNQAERGGIPGSGCNHEHHAKHPVPDSSYISNSDHKSDCGKELRLDCNNCTACNIRGTFYRAYGGIFA